MGQSTDKGVLAQHRDRMDNDEHYRNIHLTPPSTKRHHNSQDHTDVAGGAAAKTGK
jgi:hypothetical protein